MKIDKILVFFYLLGFIVFSNALSNNFIWLDNMYVVSGVFQNIHFFNIFNGSFATADGYYRPLNALYYLVLNTVFNHQPFFYHLVQIVLYIFNGYLVFRVFRKFIDEQIAFLLALVFLVHPLNEVTAVYVSASAGVLYMLFGLLALLISLKRKNSTRDLLFISVLLLLSILSKETGVIFLVLIPLARLLFQKQPVIRYSSMSAGIFILYILFRYLMHGFNFVQVELYPFSQLTFFQKLTNLPSIIFFYFFRFFYPINIGMNQLWKYTTLTLHNFYVPLFLDGVFLLTQIIGGVYISKLSRDEFKKYLFFIVAFWISLSLFFQFIPLGNTVASRWFYLPMIGLLGSVGVYINNLSKRVPKIRTIITASLIAALCFFSIRTFIRNTYLKDDVTLFTHFISVKNNYDLEFNLAHAYFTTGDYKNALIHAQKSVKMFSYDQNIVLIGYIYEKMGDLENAKRYYLKGMRTDNYSPRHHSLFIFKLTTTFFIRQNDLQHAKETALHAVQDYPTDSYMWILLSIIEFKLNDRDIALQSISKADELSPDTPFIAEVYSHIYNNTPFDISVSPF